MRLFLELLKVAKGKGSKVAIVGLNDKIRELLEGNIQRQRNADLQDDGQLMALVVRTMQRRIMDVVGMTPADYRALFTRDL